MSNKKQRDQFKRTARELECDESDDALDKAAVRVLSPDPPLKPNEEKEKPAK